ncbi:hypothetical protein VTO73DRAFT_13398 [Trametes versicolor]
MEDGLLALPTSGSHPGDVRLSLDLPPFPSALALLPSPLSLLHAPSDVHHVPPCCSDSETSLWRVSTRTTSPAYRDITQKIHANSHSQLGFRKCDVPSPVDLEHFHLPHKHPRTPLELTPKFIADPYAKASPAIRPSSSLARSSEALVGKEAVAAGLDDANIRFSDRLFEVPALKGVKVDRVATGGRSSFVKTAAGKVLGWGANEFG